MIEDQLFFEWQSFQGPVNGGQMVQIYLKGGMMSNVVLASDFQARFGNISAEVIYIMDGEYKHSFCIEHYGLFFSCLCPL